MGSDFIPTGVIASAIGVDPVSESDSGTRWLAKRLPDDKVWFVSIAEDHFYFGLALAWVPMFNAHLLAGVGEPVPTARNNAPGSSARRVEPVWIVRGFVAQVIQRPAWFNLIDDTPFR